MSSVKHLDVLVIDDSVIDRQMIRRAVASIPDIVVVEASSCADARRIASEMRLDVLLVDCNLPDGSGLALIRSLKQSQPEAAIVMISSHCEDSLVGQALDAGAHDFLLKDEVTSTRLGRAIRQAQHRYNIELQLKKRAEVIKRMAREDSLTGLANRYTFEKILQSSYARAIRENKRLAVLFIDLDDFKTINDSLGHHVGDFLLKEVGKRFKTAVRESDMLARLGGDEFVVLATDMEHDDEAAHVAKRILDVLIEPILLYKKPVTISSSIGISVLDESHCRSVEAMMRCADIAMYRAKKNGRNQYCFYSEALHNEVARKAQLERDLRDPTLFDHLRVYYQPLMDAKTQTVVGVEALIRWEHPLRGLLAPFAFIDHAETIGMMPVIGYWVLKTAVAQLHDWQVRYGIAGAPKKVSVNLSATQLHCPELLSTIKNTLEECDLPPECLELEITEHALIDDPEALSSTLEAIVNHQVSLSLDDFGTGFSSMQHIHLFPIQVLKIDKSFLATQGDEGAQDRLLLAMIQFARTLELTVVAEGVETKEHVAFCVENGCDLLQGYYYAQPLSAGDFEAQFLDAPSD